MKISDVVRVAVSDNFNCTDAEFAQLDGFAKEHPDKLFFVNCNARTPKLHALLDHPYSSVITLNPDINVVSEVASRGLAVRKAVSFYRVKWIPERAEIEFLVDTAMRYKPVVVTMQRFNSRKTLEKYTDQKHYRLDCARFRLHGDALRRLEDFVDERSDKGWSINICDRRGLGCKGCQLCATLNGAPKGTPIKSLNLSTSGVCPYSCPDCYAKAMQKFLVATGKRPMEYDTIKGNKKQLGRTKHIQNNRKVA